MDPYLLSLIIVGSILAILLIVAVLFLVYYMYRYFRLRYRKPSKYPKPYQKLDISQLQGEWYEVASSERSIFPTKNHKFKFNYNGENESFDVIHNYTTSLFNRLKARTGQLVPERYTNTITNGTNIAIYPASFKVKYDNTAKYQAFEIFDIGPDSRYMVIGNPIDKTVAVISRDMTMDANNLDYIADRVTKMNLPGDRLKSLTQTDLNEFEEEE